MATQQTDDLIGQRQQRIDILQKLRDKGIDPFPAKSKKDESNQAVQDIFDSFKGRSLSLTGRIVGIRKHGKITFIDLQDQSGTIQVCVRQDAYQVETGAMLNTLRVFQWDELALLDKGDFIQAQGTLDKTQSGQITLFASAICLLTKSLRPLPDALVNKEDKFRKRYLDLTLHPEEKQRFLRKAKFWKVTRDFFADRDFIEVETPVLEHVTGGADARPFITHHNELDQDFFLRISTELYQKRLIGAGFEKIYTLGPNFRNEGLSDEHLQEYYQMEWYWAYADFADNMTLTRELFRKIAEDVYGTTKFNSHGHVFDLADEWKIIDYAGIIKTTYDVDIFETPDSEILKILNKAGVELPGTINRNRLIDNVWKLIRKTLPGPAFLVNEPVFLSPLAKPRLDDSRLTQRYHVIIGGSELAQGYSELNDPQDQLNRFLDQQELRDTGDDEAQMLDIDFVEMLEYGMPPVSGHGHSERLFWFLENCSGREGTLFPLLKRELDDITQKIYPFLKTPEKQRFANLDKPEYFSIRADASKKWPTLNVGFAILKNVKIAKSDPKLETQKQELLDSIDELTTEQIGKFPEIQSYRKMYKEMGVDWHSRRPSPEALLRRVAQKKGLYTVNTCVDAYNLIVMKYHVSAGAFDLDTLQFPTVLRLAEEGHKLNLLGDAEDTLMKPTEIAYYDKTGPYNLDFNYRDAQRTAVTEGSKNLLINVDGVYNITRQQVERTLDETIKIIQKYCGGELEIAGIVSATETS